MIPQIQSRLTNLKNKYKMSKIIITKSLGKQIQKTFSQTESLEIIELFETLIDFPKKGKTLASVGGVVIKELKYRSFRFYFITDGHLLKFGTEDELATILIRFVRMSKKADQQKVIDEIKNVLKSFGLGGF